MHLTHVLKKCFTGCEISKPVFIPVLIIIMAVVGYCILFTQSADTSFQAIHLYISDQYGWLYLGAMAAFVIFCLYLAFSRFGDIKLGLDHSQPEFSNRSWFAMLFSAGMGIGIIFYGVAEPVMQYISPPIGAGDTAIAARNAMAITFFHWGVHAWAVYAVVGLSLAYFSFRHNLPFKISASLYPLLGERINGPIGYTVDVFSVLCTVFGIATSLGLGVIQINAGLGHLFGVEQSFTVQAMLIAGITFIATLSVTTGLDSGIKKLSNLNVLLAIALMCFVLIVGPTAYLLKAFVQNIGTYLNSIVEQTFNLYLYEKADNHWLANWTLFYWSWWIAWSPFVGMFIARISKGRTIREFIIGVLLVPSGFTFLWMTVFGNSGLHFEMLDPGSISHVVEHNLPLSLYVFLEHLPWPQITSFIATLLIVTFFVTSSDSGSLVIDTITSGSKEHPHTWQRVFWSVLEGMIAIILLFAGGLKALQSASIASALPFIIILLLICYSLLISLNREKAKSHAKLIPATPNAGNQTDSWQKRLQSIIAFPPFDDAQAFLLETIYPVIKKVKNELLEQDIEAVIRKDKNQISLNVTHDSEYNFYYAVRIVKYQANDATLMQDTNDGSDENHYYRAEVCLTEGSQNYDILGYTKDQVMSDILDQYDQHMHYLHNIR